MFSLNISPRNFFATVTFGGMILLGASVYWDFIHKHELEQKLYEAMAYEKSYDDWRKRQHAYFKGTADKYAKNRQTLVTELDDLKSSAAKSTDPKQEVKLSKQA